MIVIVGGGLVGGIMGLALSNAGINCTVVERNPIGEWPKDGRTIAISYTSQQFLNSIGLWQSLRAGVQPIEQIKVFEKNSAWVLDYHHSLVGPNPMGYIVKHDLLRALIDEHLQSNKYLKLIAPCEILSYQCEANQMGLLSLKDQSELKVSLLIGADGRQSWVRKQSDICATTKEYGQKALVLHIKHELDHQNSAYEIFDSQGPLALLPLTKPTDDDPQALGHYSGVVWCDSVTNSWMSEFNDEQLARKLYQSFPYFGKLEIASKRWVYNLSLLKVDKLYDLTKRIVLVGDSAHGLHPIAGQGVNLGWQDVKYLTKILQNAKAVGADYGSYLVLNDYQKQRKSHHRNMQNFTNLLNGLYANDSKILSFGRQLGLAAINNLPFLKKQILKKAMGI